MRVNAVKQELTSRYPGVSITEKVNSQGIVTEIIGEIDRKLIGSKRHVAVIIVGRSEEHWHNTITEQYEVIKGSLRLYCDGHATDLREGETITIRPGTKHFVEGKETWFYCYSVPDWFPEDFHTLKSKS